MAGNGLSVVYRPFCFAVPEDVLGFSALLHGDDGITMGRRACPRPFLHAALIAGALACASSAALAADAEYCVTCKNPDQTYRCKITGVGKRPTDALKLYCVIRTAKDGNHASCKAEAASAACNGLAKVYNYEGPSLPPEVAADPRVRELKQRVDQDRRTFAEPTDKAKGEAPKTLFELGGRAVDASAKGLRGARSALGGSSDDPAPAPAKAPAPTTGSLPVAAPAPAPQPTESVSTAGRVKQAAQSTGSAVSGFARKSYNCVLSLFRHCSEEAGDGAPE
jgi:hypothetical protein